MLTCELKGNLGNHLFQIWSLMGLGYERHQVVAVPDHPIYSVLDGFYTRIDRENFIINKGLKPDVIVEEKQFPYYDWEDDGKARFDYDKVIQLQGYRQSELYWDTCEDVLRRVFSFKKDFIKDTLDKTTLPRGKDVKPVICISIRRGDFVGNKTYFQLPITYYIGALFKHFPDWQENYTLLFLSDDIEYCRVHFECLPNAHFATNLTSIEQLCLGSLADHHIISNSTFSWWCAYLANAGRVVRPLYNFGEEYRKENPEIDFWPDRGNWVVFDHTDYKIPLPDVTFMIPVYYDHPDRKQNIDLCVCMLQRDFRLEKEQIIVLENDGARLSHQSQWTDYRRSTYRVFHRTKMLNEMTKIATTTVIANWDADVFVPPMQIWLAVNKILRGADFVYPYDGRFARVVRKDGMQSWYKMLCKFLDTGIFRNLTHFGKKGAAMAESSVGGAVIMDKKAFIESGMENEHMLSYAPEDCERWDRWHMLGYQVERIVGKLFHMDHFCGSNSSSKNPYFDANHAELDKIRAMTKEQLRAYVDTWEWKNIL